MEAASFSVFIAVALQSGLPRAVSVQKILEAIGRVHLMKGIHPHLQQPTLAQTMLVGTCPATKMFFPITSLLCSQIRHRLQGRLHFLLLFRGPLRSQPLHSQCLPPATKNETQVRISSQMPWSDPFWWVDESDLTRQPDIHGLRAPPQSPLKWREASADEMEAGQRYVE